MGSISLSPQIKHFIDLTHEYHVRRSEKNFAQLQRQLQILSVVSDLSIFEPTCMETQEFYMCLSQLLSEADSKSSLSWKVINLLVHISHSSTIRNAMRDELQLLPVITQFLMSSKLSKDKVLKTLQLLQELSHGAQIRRLETWLIKLISHLLSMIVESEEDNRDEGIEAAVFTLANLCRGNPPAVYILRKHSTRKIVQTLGKLKSPSARIQLLVAEIMIYVNVDLSLLDNKQIIKTLNVLFMVATDAIADQDVSSVQLSKDVFEEIVSRTDLHGPIKTYNKFGTTIRSLLSYLSEESNPLAVDVLFQLVALIVQLEPSDLTPLLDTLFTKVVPWIPEKECSSGTQKLLNALLLVSDDRIAAHFDDLINSLKEGLSAADISLTSKSLRWMCSMLNLIETLCKRDTSFLFKTAEVLARPTLSKMLHSFLDLERSADTPIQSSYADSGVYSINERKSSASFTHRNILDFWSASVVKVLSIAKLLSANNVDFKMEYSEMLENPKIMYHIVKCQRSDAEDLVARATNLLNNETLPNKNFSALVEAHIRANGQSSGDDSKSSTNMQLPEDFNISQPNLQDTVQELITKLKDSVSKAELKDIPLVDVMDLYEYKLTGCSRSEKDLHDALASADSQIRGVRLSLMQSRSECARFQSFLRICEGRLQQSEVEKLETLKRVAEVQDSAREQRVALVNEKTALEREVSSIQSNLEATSCDLESKEEENRKLQIQISESKSEVKALQKAAKQEQDEKRKLNELISKGDEENRKLKRDYDQLEKDNAKIEKMHSAAKKQNSELELLIRSNEETLAEKESQIESMTKDIENLRKIKDMIHNLSSGTGRVS